MTPNLVTRFVCIFLLLAGLHQYATMRNNSVVSKEPAVPLSDIADLSDQPRETQQPMPPLTFQYDGRPQAMRTFIVEPGATPPPAKLYPERSEGSGGKNGNH